MCVTCVRTPRYTCGGGGQGIDLADRMVMASGLSSAFSRSDINGRSREMRHMTSKTPLELKLKESASEASPVGYKELVTGLERPDGCVNGRSLPCQQTNGVDLSRYSSALHRLLRVHSLGGAGANSCHVTPQVCA